ALCVLTMGRHSPRPEAGFLARCKRLQRRAIEALGPRPRLVWTLLLASGPGGAVPLPLPRARPLPRFRPDSPIPPPRPRPRISNAETARGGGSISQALAAIPGVRSVAEQIGRAENGQDPDTPDRSEFEVQIDPQRGAGAAQIESAIRGVFDAYPNQLVEIY